MLKDISLSRNRTMASSNSQMESSFAQLTNLINETKASFDQIFAELQRQRIENEKSYQKQLQDLKKERQTWDEEKLSIEKRIASASPIINLNVGGEKMSTSRATLTLIEGTLLATMFSGKWEDKLMKDADSYIFLDYDPNVSSTNNLILLKANSYFLFTVIQMPSKSTSCLVRSVY